MQNRVGILCLLVVVTILIGGVVWVQSDQTSDKALAVYNVKNLSCGSCVSNIQEALQSVDGIGVVKVNVTAAQSQVEFDPDVIDAEDIGRQITAAGYPAAVRETLSVNQYRQLQEEETRLSPIYVARIGTRLLPRSEFAAVFKQRKGMGSAINDDKSIRLQVWNDLLQREILLGAAEENNVVVQDSEVEARIDSMKAGQTDFEQLVVARFGSLDQFARQIRNNMIIQRNLDLNVASGSPIEGRQKLLQSWYQQLANKTAVVIFDPELKAASEVSGSGCGGSCCG